jgi:hypothetical protein
MKIHNKQKQIGGKSSSTVHTRKQVINNVIETQNMHQSLLKHDFLPCFKHVISFSVSSKQLSCQWGHVKTADEIVSLLKTMTHLAPVASLCWVV